MLVVRSVCSGCCCWTKDVTLIASGVYIVNKIFWLPLRNWYLHNSVRCARVCVRGRALTVERSEIEARSQSMSSSFTSFRKWQWECRVANWRSSVISNDIGTRNHFRCSLRRETWAFLSASLEFPSRSRRWKELIRPCLNSYQITTQIRSVGLGVGRILYILS